MSRGLTGRAVRTLVENGRLERENEILRTVIADAIVSLRRVLSTEAHSIAGMLEDTVDGLDPAFEKSAPDGA